jgi:CheY-like chemotaxis protein
VDKRYRSRGTIHGFPVELKQVFPNLIGNSVQAMPDGGRLRLHVFESPHRTNQRRGVCISICDTGTGIDPEHAKHLFEPFFTTKSTKGTGLGLWISKGIIQKYGGSIHFRSVALSGRNITCFQIYLPEADFRNSEAPDFLHSDEVGAPIVAGVSQADEGVTILCVDDEDIPRTVRKLVLQKQGYAVVTASSGKEALALLAAGGISLVLSDQMMPGMTGTELTKSIKANRPSMPVILISGVNEIPPDAKYADRFISKVGGPELLFHTIAEVLEAYGKASEKNALRRKVGFPT